MVARTQENHRTKQKLVDQLVARLRDPLALEEPFVMEDRIPETRTRHVWVVWDAWKNFNRAAREAIIEEAFAASGVLKGDVILIARGLTQGQAFNSGFLPYKIVSTRRKTDPVSVVQLRNAMNSVGGVHVKAGASHQLRFPSMEYAQEAYRQLTEKVPGPYWAIVQEVAEGN